MSIFPLCLLNYFPSQLLSHSLHAVADAQHRHPALIDVGWSQGPPWLIDTRRAAGEDETFGVQMGDVLPGCVIGHDLAVYLALADATGNEHAVLGTEIEDDHSLAFATRGWGFLEDGLFPPLLLGYFEVGGYLNIVTGSYSMVV